MSSFIVNIFSRLTSKSVPLNPHAPASDADSFDDFEPDSSVLAPPSSASSSLDPEMPSAASSQILPKTRRKKVVWGQHPVHGLASRGHSTVIRGTCDNNDPEVCSGLIAHVVSQKDDALYAELIYGDMTKKNSFRKALRDVTDDLEWGLSDEDPIEVTVNKVAGKLKPVI